MIYQPRNVSPSGNSIDASKTNTFSMEIQTNTFVSYYQLIISDFDNNDIYTGNKTALDNYVYNGEYLSFEVANNIMTNGEDYKWRVKLYQQNADMQITYGIIQAEGSSTQIHIQQNINIKSGMTISINGETKNITDYDLDTSVVTVESAFSSVPQIGDKYTINSDFIETVPDFILYARKDPEVSINNIPGELTLKYHIFNGVYTQDNNVPIVYHQFNLYLKNSDNTFNLIDSSDKVYSANLTYSYDAFRTGNTYAIEMIVENDMGTIAKTELYEFNVNYEIIEYLQQPTAQLDLNKNAILVSWETPVEHYGTSKNVITGESVGENYLYNTPYSLVNSLYTNGYETEWNYEDGLCILPDDFNITLQFSPDSNFFYDSEGNYIEDVTFIEGATDDTSGNGNFKLSIDKNKFIFTMQPDISLEQFFYNNTNMVFVLNQNSIPQINNDYVWDDDSNWNDDYYWVEGGTSLERVCNHWWKIQITKTGIKIEEIYPSS